MIKANKYWRTSRRRIPLDRTLVMAILNVTPDSFSDGGQIVSVDSARSRVEQMLGEGADIIDVGGESTRPGSSRVTVDEETARIIPVIEAIAKRFDVPISVDTSKAEVADRATAAGAEIINDISSMRFDSRIGEVAARNNAGLLLMHSRGEFETLHKQPAVDDVVVEVTNGLRAAIVAARGFGVEDDRIALDVGIGFGKTPEQNLELIAKLGRLTSEFPEFPIAVGTSRKSFIAKVLGDAPAHERLSGSVATAALAVWNGAKIVRVHDVKETVEAVRMVEAVRSQL